MKKVKLLSYFGKDVFLEAEDDDTFDYPTSFEKHCLELQSLIEKCISPAFSISKPFPPVPGRGRWIVRASREYGMRTWKHFEASDDDLFQALRDLDEKMNKKK